jgi:nicotinate-nucleotide--dimethylbenzimidazole phosphoribosyltransferase
LERFVGKAKALDEQVRTAAEARQAQLTKPEGALGRLEQVAVQLAAMQGKVKPDLSRVQICIFAADHGVAEEGVSLFPQAVTAEMIRNFARGGAAISVASRHLGASLEVVDVGAVEEMETLTGVRKARVRAGTLNLSREAAMSENELNAALQVGVDAVDRAIEAGAQLWIAGEMGIANTTSATALTCAILDLAAENVTGPGTGLDQAGLSHKARVVAKALKLHDEAKGDALELLRRLGGLEIAALVGSYMSCAERGLPMLVDGFICTAAALVAERLLPGSRNWMFFGHESAEPGHWALLHALEAEPLLDLGMRLGEASGAAVALPLMRMACALHGEMATFAEAGVSGANS